MFNSGHLIRRQGWRRRSGRRQVWRKPLNGFNGNFWVDGQRVAGGEAGHDAFRKDQPFVRSTLVNAHCDRFRVNSQRTRELQSVALDLLDVV